MAHEKSLSLQEIAPFFSGKGKIILLIFLCAPFGQIFGLAIPFGLLIAYLGFTYAFLKKTWLPGFISKKKIPSTIIKYIVKQILFCIKKIAKISHPRFVTVCTKPVMHKINGCVIGLIGIFLAISLPIPLSSYIASAAILFLGVGMLNDDGILVFIGYPIALCYFVFVVVTMKYISLIDVYRS